MNITLTSRDLEILETLTLRLRVMTMRQMAELWWPDRPHAHRFQRRLTRLQWHGFLRMYDVNAHPTRPVHTPLLNWSPGEMTPDFVRLSTLAKARWNRPAVSMTICIATETSGSLMGCKAGRLPSDENLDRDLRLASVYVHCKTTMRGTDGWTSKRAIPAAQSTCCSGIVMFLDRNRKAHRALDVAGRWSAKHFANLHQDCVVRGLSYEVW